MPRRAELPGLSKNATEHGGGDDDDAGDGGGDDDDVDVDVVVDDDEYDDDDGGGGDDMMAMMLMMVMNFQCKEIQFNDLNATQRLKYMGDQGWRQSSFMVTPVQTKNLIVPR